MTPIVDKLRRNHPRFIYHRYQAVLARDQLRINFDFEIEPNLRFSPSVLLTNLDRRQTTRLNQAVINNFAFHLGLIEIPSYWKATCSPEIIIRAGLLGQNQLAWWTDLYLKGQGEFFYRNRVDFTRDDFLKIMVEPKSNQGCERYLSHLNQGRALVPIGDGKDSVVALELVKRTQLDVGCWILNPSPTSLAIAKRGCGSRPITAKRVMDPALLTLNKQGYLNGHTPFSAYLAFLSAFSAVLADTQTVVYANERSANETDLVYQGWEINHQYSKSFEFETKFREYAQKWLASDLHYFSLLRPLFELQIAKIFAGYPGYFSLIRSCNRGKKTQSWCHSCPKCLFVFAVLYPFIDEQTLTTMIFAKDLFANRRLLDTALELLGEGEIKPLDCVGTTEETIVAFYLCLEKSKRLGRVPPLLNWVEKNFLGRQQGLAARARLLLTAWDDQHYLPRQYQDLLMKAVKVSTEDAPEFSPEMIRDNHQSAFLNRKPRSSARGGLTRGH